MTREEIIRFLGADWTAFSRHFADAVSSDIAMLDFINASVVSHSGKQLRPMLSLLISRAFGEVNDDGLDYAAASEVLHNATLIHDDVADNSPLRRGRPTVFAEMGAQAAVLVGDYWLSRAIGLIMGTKHQNEVVKLFAATLEHLAEGEMLQLEKTGTSDTTEEDYLRIIYCKTASLFESTCRSAAISVDAPPEAVDAAGKYGAAVGMAFQIRDDIFDYEGGDGIGKPRGMDIREGKITLPLLGAMRNSGECERLRDMVRGIPEHPGNCEILRDKVREGNGVAYAASCLNAYVDDALGALELFPESPEKHILADLARYNAIREI
ncbi:MAG: polyprenyl synthetase family protein [Bacteroidales bacterium]|nr:polyprenyl synthetase family protein [Bacteroidales bacterium]